MRRRRIVVTKTRFVCNNSNSISNGKKRERGDKN
jgi:hypothetical protein